MGCFFNNLIKQHLSIELTNSCVQQNCSYKQTFYTIIVLGDDESKRPDTCRSQWFLLCYCNPNTTVCIGWLKLQQTNCNTRNGKCEIMYFYFLCTKFVLYTVMLDLMKLLSDACSTPNKYFLTARPLRNGEQFASISILPPGSIQAGTDDYRIVLYQVTERLDNSICVFHTLSIVRQLILWQCLLFFFVCFVFTSTLNTRKYVPVCERHSRK